MKKLILVLFIAFSGSFASAQTADQYFESKDYARAFDAYSTQLKSDPDNVKDLRRFAFVCMNIKGMDHLAYINFEKALKLDPKDVASNYYLGLLTKDALQRDLTPEQRKNLTAKAKKYLETAAALGSEEAKAELKTL